jgi:hypothetical protein
MMTKSHPISRRDANVTVFWEKINAYWSDTMDAMDQEAQYRSNSSGSTTAGGKKRKRPTHSSIVLAWARTSD